MNGNSYKLKFSYLVGSVFELVVLALGGQLISGLGAFPAPVCIGHGGQAKNCNSGLHSTVRYKK